MGYDMIGIEGNVIMSTELQFVFGDYSRFITILSIQYYFSLSLLVFINEIHVTCTCGERIYHCHII